MTDADVTAPDDDQRPRWALIVISLLVVVGAAIAALALFGGDSDDDSSATTPSTTGAGTTTPPTTAPATSAAPTTTPATSVAPTTVPETTEPPTALAFTIDDIDDDGEIPVDFTCDGANDPIVVSIDERPAGAAAFAFVVDDPDAPTDEPFAHWVVYGIPGDTEEFTDGEDALTYGINDAGTDTWFGPCPPPGDGAHEYVFSLFALDEDLGLEPGLDARALADAIADATVETAEITARYERAG